MTTVLIVILVILLIGGLPVWPYAANWGYWPSGAVTLILVILVLMVAFGRI